MTHLVNFRHLLKDIANGEILSCMMSVPSTSEKSRTSLSFSDLACIDTGNRIMRTVINLARQCHRFNVLWAIENPENSLCWMTSQLQELSTMRNVYKMTFDFCAFGTKWRKRTTVLAGHVDSADMWALHTMRFLGRERCSFTGDKHMHLVGYNTLHQCPRTHTSKIYPMKLASRLANLLLGATLTARMQSTCYGLGMQRER